MIYLGRNLTKLSLYKHYVTSQSSQGNNFYRSPQIRGMEGRMGTFVDL